MIPSLEGWPTKAKGAPSPHEVRLTPLNSNPVFQCLGNKFIDKLEKQIIIKKTVEVGQLKKNIFFFNIYNVAFLKKI